MLIYLPALVALLGLLIWVFAAAQIAKDAGRIMFACGLLAFLLRGVEIIIKQ